MQRTFVLIKRDTNEPDGVVSSYIDNIEDFDYNRETHELIVVDKDHAIFSEPQQHFHFQLGGIARKSKADIDQIKADEQARKNAPRKRTMHDVLIDLLNETRAEVGLPTITKEDVRGRL